MFDSIFATIRETLTGLFTQHIVTAINSFFGGLLG